jgi:hypothetical protein
MMVNANLATLLQKVDLKVSRGRFEGYVYASASDTCSSPQSSNGTADNGATESAQSSG